MTEPNTNTDADTSTNTDTNAEATGMPPLPEPFFKTATESADGPPSLAALRMKAGYSQAQVADYLQAAGYAKGSRHGSISRSLYSAMERGQTPIDGRGYSADITEGLSRMFGVDVETVKAGWKRCEEIDGGDDDSDEDIDMTGYGYGP